MHDVEHVLVGLFCWVETVVKLVTDRRIASILPLLATLTKNRL
jgi:hypothetical protein